MREESRKEGRREKERERREGGLYVCQRPTAGTQTKREGAMRDTAWANQTARTRENKLMILNPA